MDRGRPHIDVEIAAKYLAGELSSAGANEFENWLESSAENQHQFNQLKKLWEASSIESSRAVDVDVDRAWNSFKEKRKKNNTISINRVFPTLLRLAAVILVGCLVYFSYQYFFPVKITTKKLMATSEVVTDTLNDGSIVSVNRQSILNYPDRFSEDQREVTLNGEAFFKVMPDKTKPFKVKTQGLLVTVLGTTFNIKSYDSLGFVVVGVEEGLVRVENSNNKVLVRGGQKATVLLDTEEVSPIENYNPNEIFWKTQALTFTNDSLSSVFETLAKAYKINIDVINTNIENCRLTARFKSETPMEVFDIIDTNFGLTTTQVNGIYHISGDGCQ